MTYLFKPENMRSKAQKTIAAFAVLIIMGGTYAGIISLCNRYLRTHGLLNSFSKVALIAVLGFGLYHIYRWFYNRLNSLYDKE